MGITILWVKLLNEGPLPTLFPFLVKPGLNFDTNDLNPKDFFNKFLPEEIIDHMVVHTNLYDEPIDCMKPKNRALENG